MAAQEIILASKDQGTLNILRSLFPDTEGYLEDCQFSELHKIILGISSKSLKDTLTTDFGDVDAHDSQNRTALMWAIIKGDSTGVELLLEAKADPNSHDQNLLTPLHFASQYSNLSCMKLLLRAGVKPDLPSYRNSSSLHYAAHFQNNRQLIEILTTAGTNANLCDVRGITPLIYTIDRDNVNAAEGLLDCGADIDILDAEGTSTLNYSIRQRSHNITKLLLRRGACYTFRNKAWYNVLHTAANFGDLETIGVLDVAALEGIDLDVVTRDGKTALQIAQQREDKPEGFVEQFQKLLAGLRERDVAKSQRETLSQENFTRNSPVKTFITWLAALRGHVPHLGKARALRNHLYDRSLQAAWLLLVVSWIVGFGCASLIYLALSAQDEKASQALK